MTSPSEHNDVPLSFAKALLVQARAFGRDTDKIIAAAGFPFNPLLEPEDQAPAISVEEYSRLCIELFSALGDESGGIIEGVKTPMGSSRMLAYSIIHCQNLREASQICA